MDARIRALGAGEGELLRRVRLRALADSPESFATPLQEERALPDSEWAARAAIADAVVFVALPPAPVLGGEPVGMAGARWHGEGHETVSLWGMWVAPDARRGGLGARLVAAASEWAAAGGATGLRLGVITDVPAAMRFYERLGFTRREEERVLVRDPSRRWCEMVRPL